MMSDTADSAASQICPSCGSSACFAIGDIPSSNIFAGRKLRDVLDGGQLLECRFCHLKFRWPRLHEADLAKLYREGDASAWNSFPAKRVEWQIAAGWLRKSYPSGSNVIDVGCSSGLFLSEVLGHPFVLFGIEPNLDSAKIANAAGVSIVGDDLSVVANSERNSYDVITAFDVIEHISDPLAFLRDCRDLIGGPNGRIIVSTGNNLAWSWRLLGSRYWYCTIPEHISFINVKWCHFAAEQLGINVTNVREFSHKQVSWARRARDTAVNLAYAVAPSSFRYLRLLGMGKKDAKENCALADHPPSWITARDHLIVEFTVTKRSQNGQVAT